MNKYYQVVFNSSEWVSCKIVIKLTETDSENTLQRAIEDAFTSYENYVAETHDSDSYYENLNDYGELDTEGYEESIEKYRSSCWIKSIKPVQESEVDLNSTLLTEEISDRMEW